MQHNSEQNAPLRIVFAGTPEFAAASLRALIDSPYEVIAAYCQPDRPAGRGKKILAGPVKRLAVDNHIDVRQPLSFKDDSAVEGLKQLAPDVMVVAAYGLILPQRVLDIPRYGCINVHASLLPRWRGAAPIQRAILAGDRETGVTIMQMERGLDTGPMLLRRKCPIEPTDTGTVLHDKLAQLGAELLLQALSQLEQLQNNAQLQDDSLASYAAKLEKREAEVNWQLSAGQIALQVRAFNAWPVCYTTLDGKRVRIWAASSHDYCGAEQPGKIIDCSQHGIDVACGEGLLRIEQLQLPGAKPMSVVDLLNGHPDFCSPGQQFSQA